MNTLVSVIVPIYNVEKYLPECLDSIINQTYSNIEIILVNDGSTDNCENICLSYAKKDKRIRYFRKKNGGLSSARNYGIKKSNGEYLCFIDSDDYLKNNFVELLYKNLIESNSDISLCGYEQFKCDDVNETRMMFASDIRCSPRVLSPEEIWEEFYFKRKSEDYGIVICWNKLFKRSLFKKYRFKNILHEDEYAAHNLLNQCKRICVIDDCLYFYRVNREGSLTFNSFRDLENRSKILSQCAFDKMLFFLKHNYSNELIARTQSDWINNYSQMSIKDKRKNKLITFFAIKKLEKRNLISFENTKQILKIQHPILLFVYKISKKIFSFLIKPAHLVKRYKRKDLYVCDTYFHVLCSCAKAIKSKRKCDIALTNNIIGYQELKNRVVESKLFDCVYDFDNKTPVEIKRSEKLNHYFHGIKQIKVFKKILPFSLYWYKKVFLYNDWTYFSMYLKDLRRKYYVIEDGVIFYEIFRDYKGYPYFKKTFKEKLFDLFFPFNAYHYNYHDKCSCVKSIEVDHIENNKLDSDKKIIIVPKKELFNCLTSKAVLSKVSKIFNLDSLVDVNGNKNVILFGNCLCVDKIDSFESVYSKYKLIAEFYLKKGYNVFYKAHPREKESLIIDNVVTLNPLFPSEIILYTIENKIYRYIGVATSSVLMFPKEKVIYFSNLNDVDTRKL